MRAINFRLKSVPILIAVLGCLPGFGASRIILTNGKIVQGERVSENRNFLIIHVEGSRISLLKSLIDTVIDIADAPVTESETSTTAPTSQTPAETKQERAGPAAAAPAAQAKRATSPPQSAASAKQNVRRSKTRTRILSPEAPADAQTLEQLLREPEKIITLDLSFRDLERVPREVLQFPNLRRLDLKGNRIRELPSFIGDLTALRELDIRMNRLKTLPPQMINLTGLQRLFVTGNPFERTALDRLRAQMFSTNIIFSKNSTVSRRRTRPRPMSAAQLRQATELFDACERGDAEACRKLGDIYEQVRDFERAIAAYERGCKQDTSPAKSECCFKAALITVDVFGNRARARRMLEDICQSRDSYAEEACRKYLRK